ncbi:LutB/LldF family L-lactate oxidation iron-sulfur protein [Pseudalkalibacillus caeni]|uniref:Iron-sulfur cluster-binding protein n=1 Tax=Exobacillus caeni TaxID=2574798 RepID=A0A5R9F6T7_9BACL|nr:LutB/LldF family L-lactate oxidation iron-sulfur protein [Pseudalkalibacillus caeni]TLS36204.1 iron-sulfur cluster-binding protein [Pseudalkalibacillus caeni]
MSMKIGQEPFTKRVSTSLQDSFMRNAVSSAQSRLTGVREVIIDELGNWEEWRELSASIRKHTIENLDYYLHELSENVIKRGGNVYFARTPEEANDYITSVVKKQDAKKVVKSKSMVTEEIGLNNALSNCGCEVVETDLGEYIIQLAEDPPSHFLAPALHKNRDQIKEVFKTKRGYVNSSNPEELTQFAREQLRNEFLSADIGITGCNFAIADSGTISLVTNEGNAEMVTTFPKTQISVMGMERIVPSWKEFDIVVSMLARSAVGQKLSTYVSTLTGPRGEGEQDGPEEFHLVILDNGRSKMIGTEFQSALHCIRCSACLNVCPVYRHIGGHAYGSIYSGPIGAVISPILGGYEEYKDLPYASTLCSACTDACPVKIPLHELLLKHRQNIVEKEGKAPFQEKMAMKAFKLVTTSESMYRFSAKTASFFSKSFIKEDTLSNGPFSLKEWTRSREFPAPSKDNFRTWYANRKKGAVEK